MLSNSKSRYMFVPLVSSRVPGRLGILHLARLWQKNTLKRQNRLHPDYPAIGGGFDQMTLKALGIAVDAFNAQMDTAPTLVQFEQWVSDVYKPSADVIAQHNAAVLGYMHKDEDRHAIFRLVGLTDNTCALRDAVTLNELEDAHYFYLFFNPNSASTTTSTENVGATDTPETTDGQTESRAAVTEPEPAEQPAAEAATTKAPEAVAA